MLPKYPIPQREPLIRIIRNRRIHRGVSDHNACRRRNHPANVLIRLVPHLDPEGEVARMSCKFGLASCRRSSSSNCLVLRLDQWSIGRQHDCFPRSYLRRRKACGPSAIARELYQALAGQDPDRVIILRDGHGRVVARHDPRPEQDDSEIAL